MPRPIHFEIHTTPIPTVGWLAYGKGLDGNMVGMMQMEAKVA